MTMEYPQARKEEVVEEFHGKKIADPYRWMEGTDDPELTSWIEAQNKLVDEYINENDRLKYKKLFLKLYDSARYSVPNARGDKYFYTKNEGLQPQPVLYMKEEEQIVQIFDPNTLSELPPCRLPAHYYCFPSFDS